MSSSLIQTVPIVLSFAASDPSSGAGIQADLLTLSALGVHPACVVTALTIQDTTGVHYVEDTDPDIVTDQARVLLEDFQVQVFKIGVLGSVENVAAVAEIIADYPDIPVVFDPVLSSGRGDTLADDEMLDAIGTMLLPLTTVLTPNSIEARILANDDESGEEDPPDLPQCAQRLIEYGVEYVLLTGTHEQTTQVVNTLYDETGILRADAWERLPGSYHGSGCTLASAVAAYIAHGMAISDAVHAAQSYTWGTLEHALRVGMGQYIPDRLFALRAR